MRISLLFLALGAHLCAYAVHGATFLDQSQGTYKSTEDETDLDEAPTEEPVLEQEDEDETNLDTVDGETDSEPQETTEQCKGKRYKSEKKKGDRKNKKKEGRKNKKKDDRKNKKKGDRKNKGTGKGGKKVQSADKPPIIPQRCENGKCECMNKEYIYKFLRIVGHIVLNCQNMAMRAIIKQTNEQRRPIFNLWRHRFGRPPVKDSLKDAFNESCQYLKKKGEEMQATGLQMPILTCREYENLLQAFSCLDTYMDLFEVNQTRKILAKTLAAKTSYRYSSGKMAMKPDETSGNMVVELEGKMKEWCDKRYNSAECLVKALTEQSDTEMCPYTQLTATEEVDSEDKSRDDDADMTPRFMSSLQSMLAQAYEQFKTLG